MRKGKDAGGLPVITRDTGEKVGKVEDLVLDLQAAGSLGYWWTKADGSRKPRSCLGRP